MMIEGGSRWGYDPIWVKNEKPKEVRTANDLAVKERDEESDNLEKDTVIGANLCPDDIEIQIQVPNSSQIVLGIEDRADIRGSES